VAVVEQVIVLFHKMPFLEVLVAVDTMPQNLGLEHLGKVMRVVALLVEELTLVVVVVVLELSD
jgi:hypothetical protein